MLNSGLDSSPSKPEWGEWSDCADPEPGFVVPHPDPEFPGPQGFFYSIGDAGRVMRMRMYGDLWDMTAGERVGGWKGFQGNELNGFEKAGLRS